jgi:hypothetical protein
MLDLMQSALGFAPVNLATGANNSDWMLVQRYRRLIVLFFKAAAASGSEDPTVTLLQAQDNAGTGSKALNIPAGRSWTKTDPDLTTVGQFTAGAPSTNTLTVSGSAQKQALWMIEIDAADLDVNNGFCAVQANVADTGSVSQLGCLVYLLGEARSAQTLGTNPSALA